MKTTRSLISLGLFVPMLLAALLLAALLLAGCGSQPAPTPSVPEGARAGQLVNLKPCSYAAGDVEYAADCGTLVVSENRSQPNARLIALPLIRVRALQAAPAEPIFFLQGGPGGSNLKFQHLEGLVEHHDFIQVGYRGVDGSVFLDCPEIAEAIRNAPASDMLSETAMESFAAASRRCTTRLQIEGVDLAGYSVVEVINDMEQARLALGYERIHLLGESYGTRLEMIYQWMYPASLSRVVMIAVNPPGHLQWLGEEVDAQLEQYAGLCARDAACSARTDDLIASMRQVSENMPDHWLFFPIDKEGVKLVTFVMFMESIVPPGSPVPLSGPAAIDMWLAAQEGDYSGMALLSMARNMFIPELFVYGDLLSKAASADDFQDPARDYRAELVPAGSLIGSRFSLFHWALEQGWTQYPIPAKYRQVQPTDVRTLLVSGSIDFSTPPQFATNELLPYLSNGEQVILEDFGHTETFWYSQGQARLHLLETFFDTGEVDASLYTYQPVNFTVRNGWPALAHIVFGTFAAAAVLLLALLWFVVQRVRRVVAARR